MCQYHNVLPFVRKGLDSRKSNFNCCLLDSHHYICWWILLSVLHFELWQMSEYPVVCNFDVVHFVKIIYFVTWYYKRQAVLTHKIRPKLKKGKRGEEIFVQIHRKFHWQSHRLNQNSLLGPRKNRHKQEWRNWMEEKISGDML